jgi:molecular chaperone GrpE
MSSNINENNEDDLNEENENLENSNEELLGSEEEYLVKIGQLENEVSELNDQLLRKVAEFENYKRRTENEKLISFKYAAENFITKLLPVVDDFERSLKHMGEISEENESGKDINSIKKGIELVYEKLMKLLSEQGVKKIEAVGKPFDYEFHEAVLQRKADGVEPHIVLDEIETGYLYKDKVIRHTKVIVSEELSKHDQNKKN